ncbi:hypothetical protein SEA_BARNSTORMER_36 [Microbacterium phage Barnstormer]|uniref:DUF1918 domain-containing protein n=1 Tax=Microbacterium phage Barnstormer TaxID=3028491 RepID=A0AAE9ZK85_9CAUD|nr:hypothetical protein SEA_BARNSTORMER_36 [Microbacterium phage Barnstormer]WDS52142.1 hypothetical protein SEA_UTZCHIPS_36 [Microbacterium phage UtzChips]
MIETGARKAKPLGPVHLYPERPKAFRKSDNVADAANPNRWGRVTDVLPHLVGDVPRYAVTWEDGVTTVHAREELLSRFTTATRPPRRKKAA